MRFLRLILALYALFWFNIFVPGHTRGRVTLPEDSVSKLAYNNCCSQPAPEQNEKPTRDQQRRCAICFVAATCSIPVFHVFDLTLLELHSVLEERAVHQLLQLDFPTPFWPIGPPRLA